MWHEVCKHRPIKLRFIKRKQSHLFQVIFGTQKRLFCHFTWIIIFYRHCTRWKLLSQKCCVCRSKRERERIWRKSIRWTRTTTDEVLMPTQHNSTTNTNANVAKRSIRCAFVHISVLHSHYILFLSLSLSLLLSLSVAFPHRIIFIVEFGLVCCCHHHHQHQHHCQCQLIILTLFQLELLRAKLFLLFLIRAEILRNTQW